MHAIRECRPARGEHASIYPRASDVAFAEGLAALAGLTGLVVVLVAVLVALAPGRGVATAHQRVRELVPPLERDRVLSTDIAEIATAVRRGVFVPQAVEVVG